MDEPQAVPTTKPLQVLLIDDDEAEYILLRELIAEENERNERTAFELGWIASFDKAVDAVSKCAYDVYLLDYKLGGRTGLDLLRSAAGRECTAPIIMLTGMDSRDIDVAAMQLGAAGYLVKDQLTLPLLERQIRYALERTQAQSHLRQLVTEREALQKATSYLLSTLDLSRLLGRILDAAREAIPASEHASLCLFDQPGHRSRKLAAMDHEDPRVCRLRGEDIPPGMVDMLRSGQPLLVDEPLGDPLFRPLIASTGGLAEARCALIAPLVMGREAAGALTLTSSVPGAFGEMLREPLAAFAATATAALQNAIMYHETRELAKADPLTGVLNRRSLLELGEHEMERALRFGRPLAAMMIDLDHFKDINDRYGHAAGDQVLTESVDRFRRVVRHVDILARYGGDEFVILLPEADMSMASDIAARLRQAISGFPMRTNAGPVPASISIGVAQAGDDTPSLEALIDKADRALYQSKHGGRDGVTVG